MTPTVPICLRLVPILVMACATADVATDEVDTDLETNLDTDLDTDGEGATATLPSLFNSALFTTPPTTVSCQLDNGATTQCYKISFANDQGSTGPLCPETVDDVGGVGIYDGATNPGFQVLKRALWEAMETDGWDILDAQGNVRTNQGPGAASCLSMPLRDLTVTFLIPVEPQMLDTPNTIDVVELYGVALADGMPLTGHPPSVVNGPPMPGASGGGIPAIDPCGGHPDPAGYWHWHFTPNNTQSVLDAHGITEVSCTDVPQSTEGLVGFAKDGHPIYGPLADGSVPADLDACHGKFGATGEYPDGIYHYYAVHEEAPNLPTCIKGASVRNPMSVQ